MSYNKLLNEYVHPTNRWNNPYVASLDKRLRWSRYNASGNTKFTSTCFNVRHAHISNRNLEQKLGLQLSVYAHKHGTQCDEIEVMQEKLWTENSQRNKKIIRRRIKFKSDNSSKKQLRKKPFSLLTDYKVFSHKDEPDYQLNKIHGEDRVSLTKFDRRKQKDITFLTNVRHTALQTKHSPNTGFSLRGIKSTSTSSAQICVVNENNKNVSSQVHNRDRNISYSDVKLPVIIPKYVQN